MCFTTLFPQTPVSAFKEKTNYIFLKMGGEAAKMSFLEHEKSSIYFQSWFNEKEKLNYPYLWYSV